MSKPRPHHTTVTRRSSTGSSHVDPAAAPAVSTAAPSTPESEAVPPNASFPSFLCPSGLPPPQPELTRDMLAALDPTASPKTPAEADFLLSVPFAVLFYSSEGVLVEYCIRVQRNDSVTQISRRFSQISQFDEAINGSRWWSVVSGGASRGTLPRLTTATMGKTNRSLRLVAKRRSELDRYFQVLSSMIRDGGHRRDEMMPALRTLLHSEVAGPMALLPETFRDGAMAEGLVYSFFNAPDTAVCGASSIAASQAALPPTKKTSSGGLGGILRRRSNEQPNGPTKAEAPPARIATMATDGSHLDSGAPHLASPATLSSGVRGSDEASSGRLQRPMGRIPHITVALPRSVLYFDEDDTMRVAISSEKGERRTDTMARYRELVAFYGFIAKSPDRLPTPDEARAFFLDRHAPVSATQEGGESNTRGDDQGPPARLMPGRLRRVDAADTPSPGSTRRTEPGVRASLGSLASVEVKVGVDAPAGWSNDGPRARVQDGVQDPAAEGRPPVGITIAGNSRHLVSSTGDATVFGVCSRCKCNGDHFCHVGSHSRTTRYLLRSEHQLDISPPVTPR